MCTDHYTMENYLRAPRIELGYSRPQHDVLTTVLYPLFFILYRIKILNLKIPYVGFKPTTLASEEPHDIHYANRAILLQGIALELYNYSKFSPPENRTPTVSLEVIRTTIILKEIFQLWGIEPQPHLW